MSRKYIMLSPLQLSKNDTFLSLEDYPLPIDHSQAIKNLVEFGQKVFQMTGLYPLTFSTLDIVDNMDQTNYPKTQLISKAEPGQNSCHAWGNNKNLYYKQYQDSIFAYTWRKGGWDCNRHTEILRNGCIPYMHDIKSCPQFTMALYPKKTLSKILDLPNLTHANYKTNTWPSNWSVNQNLSFENNENNENKVSDHNYKDLINYLLKYTYFYLNPNNHIDYIFNICQQPKPKKILCIYNPHEKGPDYLGDTLLCHLVKRPNLHVDCYPHRDHLYAPTYECNQFVVGYVKHIKPNNLNLDQTTNQIKNRQYDLIWYMDAHHGLPLITLTTKYYSPKEIVILNGADGASDVGRRGYGLHFVREISEMKNHQKIILKKPIKQVTYGVHTGKPLKITDVTKLFKNLVNSQFFLLKIDNDFANGDPAPGQHKKLIITFDDKTQIILDEHSYVYFSLDQISQ